MTKQPTPHHLRLLETMNISKENQPLWVGVAAELLSSEPAAREQEMFKALYDFVEGKTTQEEWLKDTLLQLRLNRSAKKMGALYMRDVYNQKQDSYFYQIGAKINQQIRDVRAQVTDRLSRVHFEGEKERNRAITQKVKEEAMLPISYMKIMMIPLVKMSMQRYGRDEQDTVIQTQLDHVLTRLPDDTLVWPYIQQSLKNGLINEWRKQQRKPETSITALENFENSPSMSVQMQHHTIDAEVLYSLIDQLPEQQKQALLLRAQNIPYEQIAQKIGENIGTTKSLVFRGKQNLALLFQQHGLTDWLEESGFSLEEIEKKVLANNILQTKKQERRERADTREAKRKMRVKPRGDSYELKQKLREMLPEKYQQKTVTEWWEILDIPLPSVSGVFGTSLQTFSVNRVHDALMQNAEVPEEKSEELRELLEEIRSYSRKNMMDTTLEKGEALASLKKKVRLLLAQDLIKMPIGQISKELGVSSVYVSSILSPFMTPVRYSVELLHATLMQKAGVPKEKSEELQELLEEIRSFANAKQVRFK